MKYIMSLRNITKSQKKCRKSNFILNEMKREDFISTKSLEDKG